MLSKIEFFETRSNRPDRTADGGLLATALRRHLQSLERDVVVTPAAGGTLGVCFAATISGERRFLKTHLPGARGRESLAKEADILLRLYGEAIMLARFDVTLADGTSRLCLVMPALAPLAAPMGPEDAAAMVRGWNERIGDHRQPVESWGFELYLACAGRALAALSDRGLLGAGDIADLRRLIALIEDRLASLPRVLCHGDFGPQNVMLRGGLPLAIDWEDAFWGIAGYDYLYWVTFMENRPLLHDAAFGLTGLEPNVERAILALVVLLKSYAAVCSGAHLNHSMPIRVRIAEILELPG